MEDPTMTELAKLSYSVPKESTGTTPDGQCDGDGDLMRLMSGIAFPYDHAIEEGVKQSPKQRCKKCKTMDCVGVCEFLKFYLSI